MTGDGLETFYEKADWHKKSKTRRSGASGGRVGGADGIIAPDDFWASVIIRHLRSRGISVPDDVAVVGYLNHYLADWTDPPRRRSV